MASESGNNGTTTNGAPNSSAAATATNGQQPTMMFSQPTIDKVNKAKVMLENYYNNLLQECDEREERYRRLEETMQNEGLSEQEKNERRQTHAMKETEFLRLKVIYLLNLSIYEKSFRIYKISMGLVYDVSKVKNNIFLMFYFL